MAADRYGWGRSCTGGRGPLRDLCLAVPGAWGRHQDREVTEDPGTSPALRRGTPGASEAPGERPPAGGGAVAGPRPGLLFQSRHAAEREQRDPLLPEDH